MQNFNQKPINNQTTQTTLQLESKQVAEILKAGVVSTYLTASGKVAMRICVSECGLFSYTGTCGAGSGHDLKNMNILVYRMLQAHKRVWLESGHDFGGFFIKTENQIKNPTNQTAQRAENQDQEMRDEKMMSLWDGLLVKKDTYKTCGNCDAVNAEADKQCRVCGNCLYCAG